MAFYGFHSMEEYFQVMERTVETALVGICIYDKNGNFIYNNKAHEDLSGYSREMLKSFTSDKLKHMELNRTSATLLVIESKEEVLFEQNMIPTGKRFITKGIPWFDGTGQVKYVISNIIDSSKIIELEDKLEKDRANRYPVKKFLYPHDQVDESKNFIVYQSEAMKMLIERATALKDSNSTVLLRGESGTGKELIAKLLHEQSSRCNLPFIKINCSAIPDALLESELFGYMPGSFTGGEAKGKIGLLEYANGGTVLLDEIGDIPMSLQSKLLRVLQEKEIQKIGKHDPIKIDIRFIASTNVDLYRYVKEGKFREDLFYRLNVIPIMVPNLNDRREDIPILAHYFMSKYNRKYQTEKNMPIEVISKLIRMEYPGNIRQLENLIERLVLLSGPGEITINDLLNLSIDDQKEMTRLGPMDILLQSNKSLGDLVDEYEKQLLMEFKQKYENVAAIARALKVDRSTISRKLIKYGIHSD